MPYANGQEANDRQLEHPGKFISEIELLVGPSLIYGSGSDLLKDLRIPKFGFRFSLGLKHKMTTKFCISTVFSYGDKGIKFKSTSEDPDYNPPAIVEVTQDIKLNYLELSIIPRYAFDYNERLYAGIGPYIGYLLSNKLTQEVYRDGMFVSQSASRLDAKLNYKEFDFGVSLMVGSNFVFSKRSIATIQLLYCFGLVDINKPQLEKMRNSLFSLQLGLTLNRTNM